MAGLDQAGHRVSQDPNSISELMQRNYHGISREQRAPCAPTAGGRSEDIGKEKESCHIWESIP